MSVACLVSIGFSPVGIYRPRCEIGPWKMFMILFVEVCRKFVSYSLPSGTFDVFIFKCAGKFIGRSKYSIISMSSNT